MIKRRLKNWAADGYPELRRGMVVTVYRPWSAWLKRPWNLHALVLCVLAWRIRSYSARLLGEPATEHHAMIYAGGGWCWSQDGEYRLVHLKSYRGCQMTFGINPAWTSHRRNKLVADCAPHKGSKYAVRDIIALAVFALTGNEALLIKLADRLRWICSEAVCVLVRGIQPDYCGDGDCLKVPHYLLIWMKAQGFNWLVRELR